MYVKSMGSKENATFELALSLNEWEPLYRLDSCNEKYVYYQTVIDKLIEICFPSKLKFEFYRTRIEAMHESLYIYKLYYIMYKFVLCKMYNYVE